MANAVILPYRHKAPQLRVINAGIDEHHQARKNYRLGIALIFAPWVLLGLTLWGAYKLF